MSLNDDIKNAFVLDKDTNQVSMIVSEPKAVINVKEIVDNCSLVITITGVASEDTPSYFLCERADGSKYTKDFNGNKTDDGIDE